MKSGGRSRHFLACTAALTLTTQSPAQTPNQPPAPAYDPAAFDRAVELGDMLTASKMLEAFASQYRATPGPNIQLDSAYGRFLAAVGQGMLAEPYLVRAIAASTDRPARDRLAFELARAREVDGFVPRAEADYRALTASETEATVRGKAILSLARLRLGAAPDEAIALLAPLADARSPAATRWEAQLLLSRAQAIAGRAAEAKAALGKAWEEAPRAPLPSAAIALTAMDMAIDHAASGERDAEIGLITTGLRNSWFAGATQIPVCDGTLRPEDSVTIAIQADEKQHPIYSAARASRPGIAQLFTVPIAVARQRIDGPGTYVTLRCRTAPDANLRVAGGRVPDLGSWLAEKAYYPLFAPVDPTRGDPLGQIRDAIASVESKAGPDSPILVPLLLQLAVTQSMQSRFNNPQLFADAKTKADRMIDILVKAGAPPEVIGPIRMQITVVFAQNQNIAEVAGPAALELLNMLAARAETTPAQAYVAFGSLSAAQLRPTQRLALADRLLAFFDARKVSANALMRQAIELRRAGIQRELGTVAGMSARLATHGLGADLCPAADSPPSFPPSAITLTSDDYPKDLLRRDITGMTAIELSIDAGGNIGGQRMIVSQPVALFDRITQDKLKPVTLIPARTGDKAIACRGMVQSVRWQLPYQDDFSPPWQGMMGPD